MKYQNIKKILLISASFDEEKRANSINANSHYPLGLGYLHAVLEKNNYKTKTLFLNDYSYQACRTRVKKSIRNLKPNIIGFNILTSNRVLTFELIEYIHSHYPLIKIIIGGIHATVMHEQIINKYPYVIAVIGEGEITLIKLLQAISKHEPLKSIQGLSYWDKKVVTTEERPRIDDLDSLPFPKHEVFFTKNRTVASVLTSRGCPFNCSFCVLYSISRRLYKKRSIENVIQEILYLKNRYQQLETVWLHDDQFFLDNQRVIDFCDAVINKNIKLKFICSGRFKPVTKQMVDALEEAGFIEVLFGLESGSTKILERCHKMITQQDVINAVTLFKNSKIFIVTFLIVGLSGETIKTVEEGYNFIKKIQKVNYIFYNDIGTLTIYPGTEIYEQAKNAGAITDEYWLTDKPVPYFTVEHTIEELKYYKEEMLNHISLTKLLTPKGFIGQFDMIPYIIKFTIHNTHQIPMILEHLAQRFFPTFYHKYKLFTGNVFVRS